MQAENLEAQVRIMPPGVDNVYKAVLLSPYTCRVCQALCHTYLDEGNEGFRRDITYSELLESAKDGCRGCSMLRDGVNACVTTSRQGYITSLSIKPQREGRTKIRVWLEDKEPLSPLPGQRFVCLTGVDLSQPPEELALFAFEGAQSTTLWQLPFA